MQSNFQIFANLILEESKCLSYILQLMDNGKQQAYLSPNTEINAKETWLPKVLHSL